MGNLKKSDVTPMIPIGKAYALYWKQSFCWRGRATRAEYWWPMLIKWLVGVGCNQLVSMLEFLSPVIVVVLGLYGLFLVATLFPGLAVYVRRFHDLGHSNAIVATAHELRLKKVHARLDFLREELGFDLPEEEISKLLLLNNPGKPHIANLLVRYGYAENKEQGIEYIDRKHFRSEYLHPKDVISAIRDAGGIPVLAHPPYGSGNDIIVRDELAERVERLIGYGIEGLEGYYSGFTKVLRDEVLGLAERHGLLVTAGSDYHGSNKLVDLGDTGLDAGKPADGLCRFLSKIL